MDRLTKPYQGTPRGYIIAACENCVDCPTHCYEELCYAESDIVGKLGNYEDTDCTPAEIEALKSELNAFKETGASVGWIKEAISLHQQGRLIRLEKGQYVHIEPTQQAESLKAKLQKVERERDAAIKDIKILGDLDHDGYGCFLCKHSEAGCVAGENCFEWRGLEDTTCE